MKPFLCLLLLLTPAFLFGCDEYRQAPTGSVISSKVLLKELAQNARLLVGRDVPGLRAPSYIVSAIRTQNRATLEVHDDPVYVANGHFYQENGTGLTDVETKKIVSFDAFYAENPVYVLWSPDASRLLTAHNDLYEVPARMEFPLHVDYSKAYETDSTIDCVRFAHDQKFLHNIIAIAAYDSLTVRVEPKTSPVKWQDLTVGDLLKIMGRSARIVSK